MKTGWNRGIWVSLACLGLIVVGCERLKDQGDTISINPPSVTLSLDQPTVTFTAVASSNSLFSVPLEWSVSDPSLGIITASAGNAAVYTRSAKDGNNLIIVKNPGNEEGIASVQQVDTLTSSASTNTP